MQKISFGDRDYLKASDIAKRFKYTQDYVGQLCRADKVDARLVGRVWYVNPESVTEYRKTKHATQKKAANKAKSATKPKKRPTVEPVVRAKTARQLQQAFPNDAKKAMHHVAAKYSPDQASIIPILDATKNITPIESQPVVEPKPKVTIKVRPSTRKSTVYSTDKIPEITLQSKLEVTNKFKNHVPTKRPTPESNTPATPRQSAHTASQTKPTPVRSSVAPQEPSDSSTITIAPVSVQSAKQSPVTSARRSWVPLLFVLCCLVLAVTLGVIILGVGHYSESSSGASASGLFFNLNLAVEKLQSFTQ